MGERDGGHFLILPRDGCPQGQSRPSSLRVAGPGKEVPGAGGRGLFVLVLIVLTGLLGARH